MPDMTFSKTSENTEIVDGFPPQGQEAVSPSATGRSGRRFGMKAVTSVAMVGLLFAVAACDDEGDQEDDGEDQAAEEELGEMGEEDMPEPDTEDIPDVVAEVNGQEIDGDEFTTTYESQFQQMAMQAQMTGEEIDQDDLKEQTLDGMIGNVLLVQDASDAGYEVSDDDVDELLSETAEANEMEDLDELYAMAEEQGLGEDELREDAQDQVLVDQLLEDLDVEEPSEEELEEMYEEQVAQQEQMEEMQPEDEGEGGEEPEAPSFDEMRDELEEQAVQQAEGEAAMEHVEDLREDADVETMI